MAKIKVGGGTVTEINDNEMTDRIIWQFIEEQLNWVELSGRGVSDYYNLRHRAPRRDR